METRMGGYKTQHLNFIFKLTDIEREAKKKARKKVVKELFMGRNESEIVYATSKVPRVRDGIKPKTDLGLRNLFFDSSSVRRGREKKWKTAIKWMGAREWVVLLFLLHTSHVLLDWDCYPMFSFHRSLHFNSRFYDNCRRCCCCRRRRLQMELLFSCSPRRSYPGFTDHRDRVH